MNGVRAGFCAILFAAIVHGAGVSYALTPNSPVRWNDGTANGWTAINGSLRAFPVSNPGDYLGISFNDTSRGGVPGMAIMRADSSTGQDAFVGNYKASGVARIAFQAYCQTLLPKEARLVLHCPSSDSYWYYTLSDLQVGSWVWCDVPMNFAAGWTRDTNPTAEAFNQDIQNVDMVGVWIFQNGTYAQSYGLDNFVVATSSYDDDGDGMTDLAEMRAGTNPHDPLSVFRLSMASADNGISIVWPSRPGLFYNVWRSSDMRAGWLPLATEWPADPYGSFTTYIDTTATEHGPYFYRVTPR